MKKWIVEFQSKSGTKGKIWLAVTESGVIESVQMIFDKVFISNTETALGKSYDKTARKIRNEFFAYSILSAKRVFGKETKLQYLEIDKSEEINHFQTIVNKYLNKGISFRVIETVLRGTKVSGTFQEPKADFFKTYFYDKEISVGSCLRVLEKPKQWYFDDEIWDSFEVITTEELFEYNKRIKDMFIEYTDQTHFFNTKQEWENHYSPRFKKYVKKAGQLDKSIQKERSALRDKYINNHIDNIYNFFSKDELKKYVEIAHIKPVSHIKYEIEELNNKENNILFELLAEISDTDNSLLLPVNIHRLFDAGIISFDKNGNIMFEDSHQKYMEKLEINNFKLEEKFLTKKRMSYLAYHNKQVYGKGV